MVSTETKLLFWIPYLAVTPMWWWATFNFDSWSELRGHHGFFRFIVQVFYLLAWGSYTIGLPIWAINNGYF